MVVAQAMGLALFRLGRKGTDGLVGAAAGGGRGGGRNLHKNRVIRGQSRQRNREEQGRETRRFRDAPHQLQLLAPLLPLAGLLWRSCSDVAGGDEYTGFFLFVLDGSGGQSGSSDASLCSAFSPRGLLGTSGSRRTSATSHFFLPFPSTHPSVFSYRHWAFTGGSTQEPLVK